MDIKTELKLMTDRMDRHGTDLRDTKSDLATCKTIVQATAVNCATMSEQINNLTWISRLCIGSVVVAVITMLVKH